MAHETERSTRSATRRLKLDRTLILKAAVELADEVGLEALSMRRLGGRLGVEAMSLYNHVSNKDDLLCGVVDTILSEATCAWSDKPWKQAMRERAVAMRKLLLKHSWAVGLLESRRSPGPQFLQYCETVLRVLREAGFSPLMAMRVFSVLDSYIYGYCIQERNLPSTSPEDIVSSSEQFLQQLPDSAFPHLAQAATLMVQAGFDYGREFEVGLDLIIEAVAVWRVEGATGRAQP